jgi:hypothetical protein
VSNHSERKLEQGDQDEGRLPDGGRGRGKRQETEDGRRHQQDRDHEIGQANQVPGDGRPVAKAPPKEVGHTQGGDRDEDIQDPGRERQDRGHESVLQCEKERDAADAVDLKTGETPQRRGGKRRPCLRGQHRQRRVPDDRERHQGAEHHEPEKIAGHPGSSHRKDARLIDHYSERKPEREDDGQKTTASAEKEGATRDDCSGKTVDSEDHAGSPSRIWRMSETSRAAVPRGSAR